MNLKNICFVLPEEFDEHRKKEPEKPSKVSRNRNCASPAFDFLKRSSQRLFHSKYVTLCRLHIVKKQFSGIFYDTEGVNFQEEIGFENPKIYSYSELYIGSNGFSSKELLGSGGFGRVYRAVLPSDRTVVAVKCLIERGEHFEKTFMAELMAVSHLRHRNLVRLRGWCMHDEELLLVYDYMPNRSLDRVLFRRNESEKTLSWDRRKKIVSGLATALNYLHHQLETQIIHRDVKMSNVMLDSDFNARLGDFGLARWLEHELEYSPKTPLMMKNETYRLVETTRVGGTIGYLPPENFQKRSVSTAKSDVFSFGIVVLEIVSGRRAVDLTCPDDRIVLLDWIRRLADDRMLIKAGDASVLNKEIEKFVYIGLICTLNEPQSRPTMKWILEALSGNLHGNLPKLPSFRSYPLYISFNSPMNSTTTGTTPTNKSSSVTISSSDINAFGSSHFVSANGETIYLSAESETSTTFATTTTSTATTVSKRAFPCIETARAITYEEILSVTNNFSESQMLAEIDFGTSYHGFLEDGNRVIVKRLGMKTCPALRMRFTDELVNMIRLRHRNLTQLRGWCTEQGEMLVVYDYSSKYLLSHILFHRAMVLSWSERYNIVKSLASAVCYLHEEWEEKVIHRNITSSAIFLDQDMNPRLGSFALAEFLTRNIHDNPHVVIDKKKSARGIFGYMSPEYIMNGDATTMADVFSFGVVLLEVISGQMAVDFTKRDVLLVKRVHEFEIQERRYEEFVDRRLDGEYNGKELVRLMKVGLACTCSDPEVRPSMRQIVSILDGYDNWLVDNDMKKERMEEWRDKNVASLCLVRRIQALGIQ